MSKSTDSFFTREQLQAIGLGVGRGFQAFDPDNPYAGAGAALETTIGFDIASRDRDRARREQLEDAAADEIRKLKAELRAEESKRRAEQRAEESDIRAEDRAEERAIDKDRRDMENELEFQEKQRQANLDWLRKQRVVGISEGLKSKSATSNSATLKEWSEWFANTISGGAKRFPGKSPIDPYEEESVSDLESRGIGRGSGYSMQQDKPQSKARNVMRTSDGRMVKAIEDTDQDTPVFGEGGRDYAY
jgi:hypothetical protein